MHHPHAPSARRFIDGLDLTRETRLLRFMPQPAPERPALATHDFLVLNSRPDLSPTEASADLLKRPAYGVSYG